MSSSVFWFLLETETAFTACPAETTEAGWWTKHGKSLRVFQYCRACTSTLKNTGPQNVALQKAFSNPASAFILPLDFFWVTHGLFYDVVYQATSFTRPFKHKIFLCFLKCGWISQLTIESCWIQGHKDIDYKMCQWWLISLKNYRLP